VHAETEARREADSAERSQSILPHSLIWIANGAYDSAFEVHAALEGIPYHAGGWRESDGVNRQIAPGKIFFQRRSKLHDCVTSIRLHISTEGGHFVHYACIVENPNGPKINAYRDSAPKKPPDLLGGRSGGQIPVEVLMAQQCVSDGTPDTPRFVSRCLQLTQDGDNRFWGGQGVEFCTQVFRLKKPHVIPGLLSRA